MFRVAVPPLTLFCCCFCQRAIHATQVSSSLNAAACTVKQGKWKDALKYGNDVLKLEDTNVKAMWRIAQAQRGLGDLDAAKDTIVKAIRLDAKNKSLRDELELIKKDLARHTAEQKALFGQVFRYAWPPSRCSLLWAHGPQQISVRQRA